MPLRTSVRESTWIRSGRVTPASSPADARAARDRVRRDRTATALMIGLHDGRGASKPRRRCYHEGVDKRPAVGEDAANPRERDPRTDGATRVPQRGTDAQE